MRQTRACRGVPFRASRASCVSVLWPKLIESAGSAVRASFPFLLSPSLPPSPPPVFLSVPPIPVGRHRGTDSAQTRRPSSGSESFRHSPQSKGQGCPGQ
eukprot:920737-Rhodomonas_salina.1